MQTWSAWTWRFNEEELVRDVKVEGSLGCSDHRMMEFRIMRRKIAGSQPWISGEQSLTLFPVTFSQMNWWSTDSEVDWDLGSRIFSSYKRASESFKVFSFPASSLGYRSLSRKKFGEGLVYYPVHPYPLLSCWQKFFEVTRGAITSCNMIIFGKQRRRKRLLVKCLGPRTSLLRDPLGVVI